ncbi:unnamed protein product [Peronospora destructor]|uniref:Myosin-binding domain-containing protein n=1 Tax=Peronospora destructor TaxID=86335 RepID=A0AAV0TJM7_9STRA|nr:unnamed protein product [Peronospora destructor]
MEVTVASDSPLGQYLAELDTGVDEKEKSRMTQFVSGSLHAMTRKRARRDQWRPLSSEYNGRQGFQHIRRCVEVVALRQLIPEFGVVYPTIREDLQQVTGNDPTVFTAPSKYWWNRHVAMAKILSGVNVVVTDKIPILSIAVLGGALVALIAMVIAGRGMGQVVLVLTVRWVVGVATFVLVSLELSVRLLLAWYRYRSRRLIESLNAFLAALEAFDKVFACSLTLMKRAESASRGYRLRTGLLPPIGRLEASDFENAPDGASVENAATPAMQNQLRCLALRRKLRAVNEQLQIRASILVKEGEYTRRDRSQDCVKKETTVGDQAPSLLLTALTKQHNRAVLLLENAVHTVLARKLARACSYRYAIVGWSLFRTLGSLRLTVEHLIETLSTWMDDLEACNSTGDPMMLQACALDTKSSDRQQVKQHVPISIASDIRLQGVASQLHELRSTNETLTSLVIAAQYELLSVESAAERLASSRDVMRSMTQQLHEAWDSYDSALSALTARDDYLDGASGGAASEDEGVRDSAPITPLELSSVAVLEDPNCTVVFTGTSTGDEGFDLQALLKRQERDAAAASSGPKPHFVKELRDVLAHRQAHAPPRPTKQVDHDPPAHLIPALPPPAADDMLALPRAPPRGRPRRPPSNLPRVYARSEVTAGTFSLKLQALLQQSQILQREVVECLI